MEKNDYTVAYTEEAIHMMDERMILKSDVERVLSDYRENQEAIFDEETKELVTRSRLGNVTFWVRFVENRRRISGTQSIQSSNEYYEKGGTVMAVERTYYTIDPEGKLTCMKCKVPLVKGKAKFMYLENGFLWKCLSVQSVGLCMFRKNSHFGKVLAVERALEDK